MTGLPGHDVESRCCDVGSAVNSVAGIHNPKVNLLLRHMHGFGEVERRMVSSRLPKNLKVDKNLLSAGPHHYKPVLPERQPGEIADGSDGVIIGGVPGKKILLKCRAGLSLVLPIIGLFLREY